jgi:hypothetical protein
MGWLNRVLFRRMLDSCRSSLPFARLDKELRSRLGKKKISFYGTTPSLTGFAGSHCPEMRPLLIQRISAETVNKMLEALSSK